MPKNVVLFIFAFCCAVKCFAQETAERKSRLTDSVTEKYHVLKSNEQIKEGLYQALFKRKTAIASGSYANGKKTGVWHFYDTKGKLVENYDYSGDKLLYEAPADTAAPLRFIINIGRKLNDTDRMRQPIKQGGTYYGYIPYVRLFKLPFDVRDINTDVFRAQIELLISPLGRLAEYKVRISSDFYRYDRTFYMDVNLLKEPDKTFLPATFNNEPIMSRILIKCFITDDGSLDFDL